MKALSDILKKSVKPFDISDFGELKNDEFIKDNVIYCKKCNTPRIFVNELFRVRCLCECQSEKIKKEEEERTLRAYIDNLKRASLMGERYKNVSFENTETCHNDTFNAAYIRCKRYCENYDKVLAGGLGIYIYGDKGSGKTHLTACMANDLMNKGKRVLFTNFSEISRLIRSTFGKTNDNSTETDYLYKFANFDFLFIDDLGTERVQTKDGDLWLQEKIFEVLNKRYNMKKSTIFTSNYTLTDLINTRGYMDKTVDRIAEMSHVILKIEGESYRMKSRAAVNLPF